jgi:hypothetical protein
VSPADSHGLLLSVERPASYSWVGVANTSLSRAMILRSILSVTSLAVLGALQRRVGASLTSRGPWGTMKASGKQRLAAAAFRYVMPLFMARRKAFATLVVPASMRLARSMARRARR